MRICTYNVHGWVDGSMAPNPSRVARMLHGLRADVVALQEATEGFGFRPSAPPDILGVPRIATIARGAGFPNAVGGGSWVDANAVFSSVEPLSTERHRLASGQGGGRSMTAVTLRTSLGPVLFVSTHLDCFEERDRVRQFHDLARHIGDRQAIAMGDFNALRPADYTTKRLNDIDLERENADVEPVSDALMRVIDRAGWVDLMRLYIAGGLREYAATLDRPIPAKSTVTNHHGTRIDYAFATPALATALRVTGCSIGRSTASDHRPVVIDLALP